MQDLKHSHTSLIDEKKNVKTVEPPARGEALGFTTTKSDKAVKDPVEAKKKPLEYLGEYSRCVAIQDLSGKSVSRVNRYSPSFFVCQHCLLPAYGICMGWPRATQINPKTHKLEFVLQGKFAVGCIRKWAADHVGTFADEQGGYFANMLRQAYQVSVVDLFDLFENKMAPSRHQLSCYQALSPGTPSSSSVVRVEDPLEFHKAREIPLKTPNFQQIAFYDYIETLMVEDTNLLNPGQGDDEEELRRKFPGWITKADYKEMDKGLSKQGLLSREEIASLIQKSHMMDESVGEQLYKIQQQVLSGGSAPVGSSAPLPPLAAAQQAQAQAQQQQAQAQQQQQVQGAKRKLDAALL